MQKLPINPFLDFYSTPDAMIINPFVFGGGAFDPLSLSPALWLSDTGADASIWPDLSGNGRDASQADSAKRPAIISSALNGRQVRRFDGVNDLLSRASQTWQPRTIFSVQVSTKNTGVQTIVRLDVPGVDNVIHRFDDANFRSYTFAGGAGTLDSQTATTPLAAHLLVSVFEDSIVRQFLDGATGSTDGGTYVNLGTSDLLIGAAGSSEFFEGDIAEILVFPTALGTTDRQNVENYLNAKYNIY